MASLLPPQEGTGHWGRRRSRNGAVRESLVCEYDSGYLSDIQRYCRRFSSVLATAVVFTGREMQADVERKSRLFWFRVVLKSSFSCLFAFHYSSHLLYT